MPKFIVERLVDAFVIYTIVVEAETAEDAYETAHNDTGDLDWQEGGVREFDTTDYEVFDEDFNSKFCTI